LNQLFQGVGGSEKQSSIGDPLIVSHEPTKLLRYGKGDHEVMPRHLAIQLFRKPLPCFVVLTRRTMAVAAGAMNRMVFPAFLAPEQGRSTSWGAAVDDGVDRFTMFTGESVAEA
jgi:hypothetical protein